MPTTKTRKSQAKFFTAVGHHRRLLICSLLLQQGRSGLQFETLCEKTRMSASTLSHHLHQMDKGGILRRTTKGRETWLTLETNRLGQILPLISGPATNFQLAA